MTGTDIIQLVMTDDAALARALVILRNRQTTDEVASEQSRHLNDRGFRPQHARMGTSMASFYERFGYLSPKQVAWWRVRGKEGSRISIYWRQLLAEWYRGSFDGNISAPRSNRAQIDRDHEVALQMWIDEDYSIAMEWWLLDQDEGVA